MAVTLESFLENDPQVKAVRRKLNAAKAQLNQQTQALASAGGRIDETQRGIIQGRINTAQAEYDKARNEASRVESERTKFFTVNQKDIQAKAVSKEVSKAQQELEEVLALKAQYPNQPSLDARIIDLNERINQTGKYAPKKDVKKDGAVAGDPKTGTEAVDYNKLISGAVQIVRKMSAPERRELQQDLKAAGFYTGPIVDIYTDELVAAYQLALQANQQRNQLWGEEIPWGQFLTDKANEKSALEAGEGRTPTGTVSISTPLEAAAKVEDIFKAELGRLPTAEEVEKYSKKLIAREKKQSSITKATQRKVGGILVTEYTGGLDRDQFLQNLVRKTPEYEKRKSEGRTLTVQSLQGVANDNGITLSPQQLEQYALEVQNGKDIRVIQNQIRNLASLGMPDTVKKLLSEGVDLNTIYSPYKKTMASILEINPETITLSDPVLRSAIGPQGEVSLYDFQRQLRKDPRWQYTNNAREEVSTAALQVLRDFGFQG